MKKIEKVKILIFTIIFAFVYIFIFPVWFIVDYMLFLPVGIITLFFNNLIDESFYLSGLIFTGILCFFFFRYILEIKQCEYKNLMKQNLIIVIIGTPLYWFLISVVFSINQNISFTLFYSILTGFLLLSLVLNYLKQCKNKP